jgi:photosynthetic reaction center cytochrome c subunit
VNNTLRRTKWRVRVAPTGLIAAIAALACLTGCERPPVEVIQGGYRGTAMETLVNPRLDALKAANNEVPAALPAAPTGGPLAGTVYKNVKVLTDLNVAQFTRVMLAMTKWVAPPDQSCGYCHSVANMASDERYTKVVARRMLQMVRHINSDWKDHVGVVGVTCYTCHRGHVVPQYVWFENPGQSASSGMIAANPDLYSPEATIGSTSLPYDPFTPYLLHDATIRVNSTQALPGGNDSSIQQTDLTYALMVHMSTSLGVNCTYCHNTRSMPVWSTSTPKRVTAWYGIRMARELNVDYMTSLTGVFPQHRLGVLGDVAKINCETCHQGVFKPLYGISMAKDYPELEGAMTPPPATPPASTSPPTAALAKP